jgi:Rad3-related DNA helicase
VAIADRSIDADRLDRSHQPNQTTTLCQPRALNMPKRLMWKFKECLLSSNGHPYGLSTGTNGSRLEYPISEGMLLAGEGGTGKTLGVKCLAKTWGLPIVVSTYLN